MKGIYGIIGDPIEHSISPIMHNAAFHEMGMDCVYLAFRVGLSDVEKAVIGARSLGILGLNVTIPLKEKVIEFVELDPLAERVGAVNTIDLRTNIGYNTDAAGIKMALEDEGININGKKLLLLGAGGAARAIAFQMKEDGADITIANRTGRRAIDLAREVGTASIGLDGIASVIGDMDILINATSVGMCPDVESTLVTADMMHRSMIIFDIIYNPAETKLLREAKKAGAKAIGGVTMLVHQGAESFKIWTSKEAPLDVMEAAVRERMVG